MRNKIADVETGKPDKSQFKRKPGRRPMTAEEKETAAKARAEEIEKAKNLRPELFLQYQDSSLDLTDLVEVVKADFRKTKKRTLVTDLKLYIKPEDHMAYYVINETFEGKVPLFN